MAKATGKDHARVNLAIWGDDDWLDLGPAAQHLYLVLWTSPGLSYCGAGEWRPAKIAQRARGWTARAVELAAAELSRELFLMIDTDTEEFLLRSWAKHDGLWKQPNMAVSMANARNDLASRSLRGVVVFEALKIRRDHPELSGWKRPAVADLLDQRPIDPAGVPTFNPTADPTVDPSTDPGGDPSVDPYGRVTVDPSVDPGPTPAPAPISISPTTRGGYVSTEGNEATAPDGPPPNRCARHHDDPDPPPCRACGDARRAREDWDAEQARARVEAQRSERHALAELARDAIAACTLCDDSGYRGSRVCNHDPDTEARAARGLALVRQQLSGKAGEA
ncbi:helix-turn-helix DNA-binding domain protein [Gordonia phage Ruthy]|uniref:Helix-turn-helix DNA-binding domain protein n=1 Tax=Gordonia phage Ruthy TaxID=2250323 RepID=A0A345L5I0_9CAUD|nr:replication initiation protein [Gordonia phage Ruthy]AXH50532.1 helix-turn-helix DNA-binding domain protein [Gordonia phage Ruthy]